MSIKSTLVTTACHLGGFRLARFLTRSHPRVLMYHRFSNVEVKQKVSSAIFEQQIIELKNNFNVHPLSRICELIRQRQPLPHHCISLTIDDGYDDFHDIAYPILKKYKIPATVYVTSDFIDRKLWLWPDKIAYILKNTGAKALTYTLPDNTTRTLSLLTVSDRDSAWSVLNDHCLSIGHEERSIFIHQLSLDLAVTVGAEPELDYAPMSWSAVRELSNNGIEIGAHSRTHPVLSNLGRDRLLEEIKGSKKRIEQFISRPVTAFCYPNGQRPDYNDLVKRIVIESSFSSATVAFHDKAGWQDLFEIRRYSVSQDMVQFRKAIYGIEYLSDLIA
jgi:peptidoglycan/xylan/chitin deacetylase (PgdA/CDA1 family)